MAAPSSSSCEAVDLALAASCDDATSRLFFSKAGSDGDDLSWPAAAVIESKLTDQESLVALCEKHGVPSEFTPVCAHTLGFAVCEMPPQGSNVLCVHSDALEAGLRFPLHDFYPKLLRHYRLAPSQLAPNAWKYMAGFVLRCKDAGVKPLVSAFRYFFTLYTQDNPLGWHHFQPCAGRHRLFSGTLPTRYDWRTRFFFLKSPEGMPWKCPVAWGKPRIEDARRVEDITDATVEKLKHMPCIDLRYYLSLHDSPVGDLTLLQLHSTPERPARALALTSPHVTVEAGARAAIATDDSAGDAGDSTPRKRRCSGPAPAPVTTPQSSTISPAPPSLQSGGSEISVPPGIRSDCEHDDDMARMQDENQMSQLQVRLQESEARLRESQEKLRESEAVSDKFFEYLYKERARLIEEQSAVVARVQAERAAEVARLREEHEELTRHLKEEHAASIARLIEEHAADLGRVKDAAEKKVQDVMKNVVRSLYPEADLSQLVVGPKLKGDLAAAATPEAEGRSATS